MARSIRVACAWCFLGTLSSTLTSRWFQHLCSPASGYTFRSALQIPRCPSPITSFGAFIPRSLRSRSTADQLSVDSRCPLATVTIVVPLLLQSSDRGRRQRRRFAQKTPQGQVEVSLRQAVQIELRQKLGHFLRLALEQRQDAALEASLQAPHSRAAHGDRSVAQRQVARLAMTVAVARSRVD